MQKILIHYKNHVASYLLLAVLLFVFCALGYSVHAASLSVQIPSKIQLPSLSSRISSITAPVDTSSDDFQILQAQHQASLNALTDLNATSS